MENHCKIQFDGICIYIESTIKASIAGKIILATINLIVWPGFFFLAALIPVMELKYFIFPLAVLFGFLVFVVGRYSAWNFWGKEFVRLNTKSVSYSRSYGIVQTKEKIVKIIKLGYAYEYIRTYGETKYGRIYVFNYDQNNNPNQVYETAVLISETDAKDIIDKIEELLEIEFMENRKFTPYTLN